MQMNALVLSLATLSVPALAQGTNPAVREASALNFVQGQAALDGQPVTTNPNSTPQPLHAGDVLATSNGTADVMLAPGALLRLGHNTSVAIVTSDSNRAEARLESGHANVAVNTVSKDTLLLVDMPQGQTQMLKRGLYTFDVPTETMRVYNGEADAFAGANTNTSVKPVKVKSDHQVIYSFPTVHATGFDQADAQQDLLPWTGPQETHAALVSGAVSNSGTGFAPVAYGYAPYGYGFGYPYPYLAYGWPYGFYDYPFGWGGYPWVGVGFGWGGWYGPRVIGGYRGVYGYRGGYGFRGGYVGAAHGFAGGGFHGGGGRR
jgi:5'-3' exoribonuclease 2